jgi:catechol 2,3-dioxygenase-like lactoylglutathione lyase family enzyme
MNFSFDIDHIQIAIPKGGEDQARIFFGEMLGLEELPKPPELAMRGGCWFAVADRQIHLGIEVDFKPAKKAHVALNTCGLDELRARLELAGYQTHNDTDLDGRMRFFTHDPFGNRIEFMDRVART